MITPCAKRWIVQTTGNGVVERIERRRIVDSLHGNSFDLLIGEDTEVDASDGGGNRPSEIRHVPMQLLEPTEHARLLQKFCGPSPRTQRSGMLLGRTFLAEQLFLPRHTASTWPRRPTSALFRVTSPARINGLCPPSSRPRPRSRFGLRG